MDLAHAFAAQRLAARAADRRFATSEAEVRAAERRVLERRRAAAGAAAAASARLGSGGREYSERGRHAAGRPAPA